LGRPYVTFDVTEALKLKSEGLGVRKIASMMGVSKTTVAKHLSVNPSKFLPLENVEKQVSV